MTTEQARRERILLESRIQKMIELFERKVGVTVRGISFAETTVHALGHAPKNVGLQVYVDVSL